MKDWRPSFAWLPVETIDGARVWLRRVEWRVRLTGPAYEVDYRLPRHG